MPEFKERPSYEEQIKEAMQEVFKVALEAASSGLESVNEAIKKALKKYVGPILEEIHRRAIIIMLILFGDDDRASSVMGGAERSRGPVYDDLMKRAKREADQQTEDLGDEMVETNKSWYEEWDEEIEFGEWAKDRLLADSRAENVAITETTNAVSLAEKTVADRMGELGLNVDALWITKRDERVCRVCGPLHLQPISQWRDDYPAGPPAHPRCRCYLDYFLSEQD
jgi:hypothetical protein